MIDSADLMRRMTQIAVRHRYGEQRRLEEVLTGEYDPNAGEILPGWKEGSARGAAFSRAKRKVQTEGPRIVSERVASAYGDASWANAKTGTEDPKINAALEDLDVRTIGRDLAIDFMSNGIAAALAYRNTETGRAHLDRLSGLLEPYVDPQHRDRITGLFRTVAYVNVEGKTRWRTEVYDWEDSEPGEAIHRYWSGLEQPDLLGVEPDVTIPRGPRPAYQIDRMTNDGLPVGQLETALPFIVGLYATELQIATTEELAAYPMLKVRGSSKGIREIGPAEVVGVDADGDAEWMQPGNLETLERRRIEKRAAVREAAFLYAGSLGTETPSGEALIQANRVPMQADKETAKAVSEILTSTTAIYLTLLGLPEATVTIQPDQEFHKRLRLEVLKIGDEVGAVPFSVKARAFQELLGGIYTDKALEEFLDSNREPTLRLRPGEIA